MAKHLVRYLKTKQMASTLLKVGVVGSSLLWTLRPYGRRRQQTLHFPSPPPSGIFLLPLHESQVTEAMTVQSMQKYRSAIANMEKHPFPATILFPHHNLGQSHQSYEGHSSQSPLPHFD